MLGDRLAVAAEPRQQPPARALGVGHRLQRGEGLRRDDEKRFRRVQVAGRLHEIGPIDVRHEAKRHRAIAVVLERLVGHHRAEVGAADADVDDVANALAGVPRPRAAPHPVREVGQCAEYGVDLGHHVLAVHDDGRAAGGAQGDMQDGPVFRLVDLVSSEHAVDALAQAGLFGQSTEQAEGLVGDAILRVVEIDANRLRGQPLAARRVGGEELAEVQLPNLLVVGRERLPCRLHDQRGYCGHGSSFHFRGRGRLILPLLPQAKASERCVRIVPGPATRRQRVQLVNIAAPENDVLGLERRHQTTDHVLDIALPSSEPVLLQCVQPDVLLEGSRPVGQVAQLHRLHDAVDDQGRAQAGSQAEKEHLASPVTAQRLHRGIVDDLDRASEGGSIVESDPARAEVTRLHHRTTLQHRARIADRHRVVFPARGDALDSAHHLLGRERRPRGKLPRGIPFGDENLHVSTADVHHQHAHVAQLALSRAALLEAITSMSSRQELTKDLAPSSWSWRARASTSMPAPANRANTSS